MIGDRAKIEFDPFPNDPLVLRRGFRKMVVKKGNQSMGIEVTDFVLKFMSERLRVKLEIKILGSNKVLLIFFLGV